MGPIADTADVPIAALHAETVGQYTVADLTVGAHEACLHRPTCVGYSSTAGITFDCAGPKCDIGTGTDDFAHHTALRDFLAFAFVSTRPAHSDLLDLAPDIPTPAPTPFATRSPTPATARVQVSTGRADVTELSLIHI